MRTKAKEDEFGDSNTKIWAKKSLIWKELQNDCTLLFLAKCIFDWDRNFENV